MSIDCEEIRQQVKKKFRTNSMRIKVADEMPGNTFSDSRSSADQNPNNV